LGGCSGAVQKRGGTSRPGIRKKKSRVVRGDPKRSSGKEKCAILTLLPETVKLKKEKHRRGALLPSQEKKRNQTCQERNGPMPRKGTEDGKKNHSCLHHVLPMEGKTKNGRKSPFLEPKNKDSRKLILEGSARQRPVN